MNKEEATKFLALIKIAYPKAYRNMDNDSIIATINMWHKTFSDVPYAIMEMALDHFRRISEFEPTVASIFKELRDLHYAALEDVLTSRGEKKIKLALYVMSQTERFKEGASRDYKINYEPLAMLDGANQGLFLEGGQEGVVI